MVIAVVYCARIATAGQRDCRWNLTGSVFCQSPSCAPPPTADAEGVPPHPIPRRNLDNAEPYRFRRPR